MEDKYKRPPTKQRARSSTKKKPRKPSSSNKIKKRGIKSKSVRTLKAKLWRIFSWFIRLRDSDEDGYCHCFTSGKRMFWKEAQAGHFMSRRYNATMFHEQNSHAQCAYDNCHLSGNQFVYGIKLNETYGPGTAEELLRLSKEDKKFTTEELEEMIKLYTYKVNKLLDEKGLPR